MSFLAFSLNAFSQTSNSCLVGYWPFNGNANDESGIGNNVSVHGTTLTTDRLGNSNSACYFDGVDDYIEVADALGLDFENNGTLSFWVKQDGDIGTILWKRRYSGSIGWTIYFGFPNTIIGYVNDNATWVQGTTTSSLWQHIVLISNNGVMKLYINCSLVDTKTNTSGGFQKTNTPLLIGTDENNNYFNGTIDDIRIFNCAIDDNEINSLCSGTPLGIINFGNTHNNLSVYPNPTKDKITILSDNNFSKEVEIKIFNITGQQMMSNKFKNENLVEFDVSNYLKGIYLVTLQTANEIVTQKLVIQ
jgi:hypothetical protein